MKADKEPAAVRAHKIIRSFKNTLAFEEAQIREGWNATYAGEIADVQEVFDAVPSATPAGMSPVPPSVLIMGSFIQIVTHNATLALLSNPALLGNPNMGALFGALEALRNDPAIPKAVQDTPPCTLAMNANGSVTVTALPEIQAPAEPE